jgi:plastocyanin
MNKCVRPENLGRNTKLFFTRSTWFPALLYLGFLLAVLIIPQGVRATPSPTPDSSPVEWYATVGAQSADMGRQALAFLPNEIWIHAGDSITWRWDADDAHTVTFLPATEPRPNFGVPPFSTSPATFDGSQSVITPPLTKPSTFTVIFPSAGNFMLCACSMKE